MKSLFLLAALLFAVAIGSTASFAGKVPQEMKKQRATMQFSQPVRLHGVVLKGEYLFVHDDAAMMRGEACTFIYKGNAEIASKLVTSFRCTPAERIKVKSFTVRTEQVANFAELREFQFAGETEAHLVPAG